MVRSTKKTKKNNVHIIIRPKIKIKSRQWWISIYQKIKKTSLKIVKKKNIIRLIKNCRLSILITNNKEIQKLNKYFRKINKPTDVLSFGLNKKEQIKNKYLGDIVISLEKAKSQAKERKIKIETELKMLFIHSYLHLLGYDHKQIKDATTMFKLQNKILEKTVKSEK